jgi:DNA-binding NarL/FixJ family response regulator
VLTMYDDQEMITKMMEMGANAYLTKTTDPDEIYEAIITVMNDEFYFNDLVNKAVLLKLQYKKKVKQFYPNTVQFSEKELKILRASPRTKRPKKSRRKCSSAPAPLKRSARR